MGASPDEIERTIGARRRELSEKVDELTGRVQSDVEETPARIKQTTSETGEQIMGGLKIDQFLRDHPLSAVIGVLGLGVALGIGSESMPKRKDEPRGDSSSDDHRDGRASGASFAGMAAPLSGILDTVQTMATAWLTTSFRELLDGFTKGAGMSSRSSASAEPAYSNGHERSQPLSTAGSRESGREDYPRNGNGYGP